MRFAVPACTAVVLCTAALPAMAETVAGPVKAEVLRVVDGDTMLVRAVVWPQHAVTVLVRLRGIDAPELSARCKSEQRAAMQARFALAILAGDHVELTDIGGGKYYGRVLAKVESGDGVDLAQALLQRKLARPYSGQQRPRVACAKMKPGAVTKD